MRSPAENCRLFDAAAGPDAPDGFFAGRQVSANTMVSRMPTSFLCAVVGAAVFTVWSLLPFLASFFTFHCHKVYQPVTVL